MLKLTNNNKGFTLVEVLTSFAVLAIISVALLQMFVVSTKTNGIAYNTDKANALCTDMAESFKSDPDFVNPPQPVNGFTSTTTTGGILYTKYYSRDWKPCAPSGAEFSLTITVSTTSAIGITEESYHPQFVKTGELSAAPLQYLEITSAGAVSLDGFLLNGGPGAILYDAATTTASMAIKIGCSTVSSGASITLNVNNRADAAILGYPASTKIIADIYLCDIPPSRVSINLEPKTGYSSENRISTQKTETLDYKAVIDITRCSDNTLLADNTVNKRFSK